MPNWYADRDLLKSALSIPASASGAHDFLDAVLEGVSRNIEDHVGFSFYPSSQTRYYRPVNSAYLALDFPLLSVDSITLDTNGNGSYESTLDSTAYYLTPYNATEERPPRPWWGIELRSDANASAVFPVKVAKGAKVAGTWGYYDQRTETTAKPTTAVTAAQNTIEFAGASGLSPGMMLCLDSEQICVLENGLSGSDTATTSGIVRVQRALNGTTGATHSSLSTMSIYGYPIVSQAALYQAEMDYRGKDAPMGIAAGGEPGGGQRFAALGGLHPFVRRMLEPFREPTIR